MMVKCPSDCPHPYLFHHSLITTERIEKRPDGERIQVTTVTLICRECGHWTEGHRACRCPFKCHEEEGVWVTREALIMVL
jgi:rubrerythrin